MSASTHFDMAYIVSLPLFWVTVTLAAFCIAVRLSKVSGNHPAVNPVLVSVTIVVLLLLLTRTSYSVYLEGGQMIGAFLGPATVALAVPMYRNLRLIRRSAGAVVVAVACGAAVSSAAAAVIGVLSGASPVVVASLMVHSTTTPIAIGIGEHIGANASLIATFTLITAMVAVVIGPPITRALRVRSHSAQGLAAGTVGHGLATARMLEINQTAGAFSGVAMGLNAVVTSLLATVLSYLFIHFGVGR
jgi:putative effector of murein hydrolase